MSRGVTSGRSVPSAMPRSMIDRRTRWTLVRTLAVAVAVIGGGRIRNGLLCGWSLHCCATFNAVEGPLVRHIHSSVSARGSRSNRRVEPNGAPALKSRIVQRNPESHQQAVARVDQSFKLAMSHLNR